MKNICNNETIIEIIKYSISFLIIVIVLVMIILLLKGFIKLIKHKNRNSRKYFKKIIIIDLLLLIIPISIYILLNNFDNPISKCINNLNVSEVYESKINEGDIINNKEKNETNEIDEKLSLLGNINKSITFFLMDNLDRYISYKNNNTDLSNEMVVIRVNMGLDQNFYSNILTSPYQYTEKVLVNKYYNLGSNYTPSNLISLSSECGTVKLDEPAAIAFNSLCEAAKAEGLVVYGVSGYRSYDRQNTIYNSYLNSDSQAVVDTYSARPGHSEHQTGLAIDVSNKVTAYNKFGNTESYKWIKVNAHKYGFVIRYTTETQFITGYKNEPWHLRYFGETIATYLYENNMTYEEYYVRFLQQ